MKNKNYHDLLSGFIRTHILFHAIDGEVFGLGIIEELRRHGYEISAGTLYPMLHNMEKRGYLRSKEVSVEGKIRRVYVATSQGKRAMAVVREQLKELLHEVSD
jgi:DNA-binding PadR family transcriptional regulator